MLIPFQSWSYERAGKHYRRRGSVVFTRDSLERYKHYEQVCDDIGPELFEDYGPPD